MTEPSIAASPSGTGRRPRVLLVPNALFFPPYLDELAARAAEGATPRAWVNELTAEVIPLDQRLLTAPTGLRRRLYRRLPFWLVQVLEAHRVGDRFDVVLYWSVAHGTFALAALRALTRRRMRLVAILTRVSEPKKARLLTRLHRRIERIILPPVTQREFAMRELGVGPGRLVGLPWTLDTTFWTPDDRERALVSAAGGEMRDYGTLVEAMRGLPGIPCHIAGVLDTERPDWWNAGPGDTALPPNVTTGTMDAVALRDLYRRSRFVVVPLQPTDSDNGITCMNEAWATGCAVIVSAVAGQRGAFTHGEEGLWVPPGDPDALRAAIALLWAHPEEAARMGESGRRRVLATRDHAVFAAGVDRIIFEETARVPQPRRTRP